MPLAEESFLLHCRHLLRIITLPKSTGGNSKLSILHVMNSHF